MSNIQDGDDPPVSAPTAAEATADFNAVYDAMMEELGDGRLDTLPLEDKQSSRGASAGRGGRATRGGFGSGSSGRGTSHSNQSTINAPPASTAAWHNFADVSKSDESHGPHSEANGRLARERIEAAKAAQAAKASRNSEERYTEFMLNEARALNASYSRGSEKARGASRGGRGGGTSSRGGHHSGLTRSTRNHRDIINHHLGQASPKVNTQAEAKEAMHRMSNYPKKAPQPPNARQKQYVSPQNLSSVDFPNTMLSYEDNRSVNDISIDIKPRTSTKSSAWTSASVGLASPEEFLARSGFIDPTNKKASGLASSIYAPNAPEIMSPHSSASESANKPKTHARNISATTVVYNPLPVDKPINHDTATYVKAATIVSTTDTQNAIKEEPLVELKVKVKKNGTPIEGNVADLQILWNGSPLVKLILKASSGSLLLEEIIKNPALIQLDGVWIKFVWDPDTWLLCFQTPLHAKNTKSAVDDPVAYRAKMTVSGPKISNKDDADIFSPAPGLERTQAWHDMNDISNGVPLISIDENENITALDSANESSNEIMADMVSLMITTELVDLIVADISNCSSLAFLDQVQRLVRDDHEARSNPKLEAKFNRVLEGGLRTSNYAEGHQKLPNLAYAATAAIVSQHIESKETMRSFSDMHPSFAAQLTQAVYDKTQKSTHTSKIQDSRFGQDISAAQDKGAIQITSQASLSTMKRSDSLETIKAIPRMAVEVPNTKAPLNNHRGHYTFEELMALRPQEKAAGPPAQSVTKLMPKNPDAITSTKAHITQSNTTGITAGQDLMLIKPPSEPVPAIVGVQNKPAKVDSIDIITKSLARSKIADGSSNKDSASDNDSSTSTATKDFESLKKSNGGLAGSRYAPQAPRSGMFDHGKMLQAANKIFSAGSRRSSEVGDCPPLAKTETQTKNSQKEKDTKQEFQKQDNTVLPSVIDTEVVDHATRGLQTTLQKEHKPNPDAATSKDSKEDMFHSGPEAEFKPNSNAATSEKANSADVFSKDSDQAFKEPTLSLNGGLKASRWANPPEVSRSQGALADYTKSYGSMINSMAPSQFNSTVGFSGSHSIYLPPSPATSSSVQSQATASTLRKVWVQDAHGNMFERMGAVADDQVHSTSSRNTTNYRENVHSPHLASNDLKDPSSQDKARKDVQAALQSRLNQSLLDGRRRSPQQ